MNMKFLLSLSMVAACHASSVGHTQCGTDYGSEGVKLYTENKHGPDGALFLDPYLHPYLESYKNKKIVDIGSGSGNWAIYAAEKWNSTVEGIDLQEGMVAQSIKNANAHNVSKKVHFTVGSAGNLPYSDNQFDAALSLLVTCNLPSEISEKHFSEINRVLSDDGEFIFTIPTSLDTVFTNGEVSLKEIYTTIDTTLEEMNSYPSAEEIQQKLLSLVNITSATFAVIDNRLQLVGDVSILTDGQQIWRKLPVVAIPNIYHSEETYLNQFSKYNFTVEKIWKSHFKNYKEWEGYNLKSPVKARLGEAYISTPPFAFYVLKKTQSTVALQK
jgi:SAM-dependent methyltransferase